VPCSFDAELSIGVSVIAARADHSTPAKPISGDPRELPGDEGFPPAVA